MNSNAVVYQSNEQTRATRMTMIFDSCSSCGVPCVVLAFSTIVMTIPLGFRSPVSQCPTREGTTTISIVGCHVVMDEAVVLAVEGLC